MQDILAVEEYKRDLLLLHSSTDDAKLAAEATRRGERREAAANELRDTVRRMRGLAIRTELERIAKAGLHDADNMEAYRRLVEEQGRLQREP